MDDSRRSSHSIAAYDFSFSVAVALRPRNGLPCRPIASGRLALAKGRTSRSNTAGPAGKNTRPLCGGSGTVTQSLRQCEPAGDVLIRVIIRAIADYAAETTERRVALGSRRGSHGEERRHPLLNIRRSCSAVSAPRCQAGVPPPFCSHGYERAFPEPNPVRRLAGTSRPAIQRDGGATQRK